MMASHPIRAVVGAASAAIILLLGTPAAFAQMFDPRALEGDPATATSPLAPRLDGMGNLKHPVTTKNRDAQAFFDQGLNLVYGFNHSEAIRAFKESARLDPDNAMAFWGQALALGPNLNLAMQPEAVAPAFAAIHKAIALKDRASPAERDYIDALALRYSDDPKADRAALDLAYATAMGKLAGKYPQDTDAATLYADALMNLSPWHYWNPDGTPRPNTPVILSSLESVMARDPDHIGALHLYIHAEEAAYPQAAVRAADRLLTLAPAAGHLVHMPSHIYMRVGRYGDAYAANVKAAAADEKYIAQCQAQGLYPLLYYSHNLHFLVWAATMQGRSKQALEDARKVATHIGPTVNPDKGGIDEFFLNQPVYVLARFGEWKQILKEPPPPANAPWMNAVWHYARGLAYRHTDDVLKAEDELAALRRIASQPGLEGKTSGFASVVTLMGIAEQVLAGEIESSRGRHDTAIGHFEHAVRMQDALPYDEPPDWYFPVRHYLGAELLEAGYPAEAEIVYWQDLARNPRNPWALLGLAQSLAAQDKHREATEARKQLEDALNNGDVKLKSSRF